MGIFNLGEISIYTESKFKFEIRDYLTSSCDLVVHKVRHV